MDPWPELKDGEFEWGIDFLSEASRMLARATDFLGLGAAWAVEVSWCVNVRVK